MADTNSTSSSSHDSSSAYVGGSTASTQVSNTTLTYLNSIKVEQKRLEESIKKSNDELDRIKGEIKSQASKNIEVIGIFSSVIALLIINVNIVLSATDILSAILLIIGLTASISVFALLIHHFFNTNGVSKLNEYFWIPALVLSALLVVGLLAELGVYNPPPLSNKRKPENKESVIINNNLEGQTSSVVTKGGDTLKVYNNHQFIIVGDSIK
ncbi:hypothetical protein KEM09_17890 [Carboxylicivirga mesophila]|uniref:Uncharacterized protein n=1 Tax=Carboxylicivirga mesophila TaxID=1166478 RepID=A0ABS5KE24_9BACT|nr:hypothetical protein [Carboxylicivirga mesophila]MBS2213291.1 hypothetical protein [Carboxylicivirga mesophila]